MFANSVKSSSRSLLQNTQRRSYTFYGSKTYQTGWEKMILDKLQYFRAFNKVSLFTFFGFANAACYGLSHVMSENNYRQYFAYKGTGKSFDLFRSWFGSESAYNAGWTVPSLILLGQYMHGKVGPLTMLKFTPIALLGIAGFQTAFSPNPDTRVMANFRLLGGIVPNMGSSFGPHG